ncbi:MAG TPA: histidine phosphatase family protein [Candidatus Eisenbergiella merdavium]|uniref:Histidine phosphatase family protein n=1 Tax=Candidatus Eisenbergiella merdavium TaxID=2838551 RepID=A0A9D2NFH7_9FIRM|nr:histidine phosphatase family protein [Candidatus Eisenbergiella merdavium]
MRIIFIRHGDPDYEKDSLTEKGWREAALLAERVARWEVTDFYVSPLGRVQDTASLSLKKAGRQAQTLPWLREFHAPVNDPARGEGVIPWDFLPGYWTKEEGMYDRNGFADTAVMRSGPVKEEYARVCAGLDGLLARYGYVREGGIYRTDGETRREDTIVLFCHMGITLFLCGHLLGISPVVFTGGFFLAPTSVTVLASEEREDGIAYFRCQTAGDTAHLLMGGEPVSYMGYFTEPFQG